MSNVRAKTLYIDSPRFVTTNSYLHGDVAHGGVEDHLGSFEVCQLGFWKEGAMTEAGAREGGSGKM